MRIPCPFCGERGSEEFVSVGLVPGPRPPAEAPLSAFVDYPHLLDNPAGTVREHWQHVYGCRRWLVVTRDTRNHLVATAEPARSAT